jgi:hypothetical protein
MATSKNTQRGSRMGLWRVGSWPKLGHFSFARSFLVIRCEQKNLSLKLWSSLQEKTTHPLLRFNSKLVATSQTSFSPRTLELKWESPESGTGFSIFSKYFRRKFWRNYRRFCSCHMLATSTASCCGILPSRVFFSHALYIHTYGPLWPQCLFFSHCPVSLLNIHSEGKQNLKTYK